MTPKSRLRFEMLAAGRHGRRAWSSAAVGSFEKWSTKSGYEIMDIGFQVKARIGWNLLRKLHQPSSHSGVLRSARSWGKDSGNVAASAWFSIYELMRVITSFGTGKVPPVINFQSMSLNQEWLLIEFGLSLPNRAASSTSSSWRKVLIRLLNMNTKATWIKKKG